MKKKVQYLITRIIKYFEIDKIVSEIQFSREKDKYKSSVTGKNVSFYRSAAVENLQKDKEAIKIAENAHIRGELLVWRHGGKIEIGSNFYLGPNSRIWSGSDGGITIGDNVLISHNVTVVDSDSHEINYKDRAIGFENLIKYGHPTVNEKVKTEAIAIEDHVWISFNVSILKGVKIGKGAIIGAGSVVTKDIPPFSLAIGNPAVVVKQVQC